MDEGRERDKDTEELRGGMLKKRGGGWNEIIMQVVDSQLLGDPL